jgi:hypothetical protein
MTAAGAFARAREPVVAHQIAEERLARDAYERTRGVAQQAARLARPTHLERTDRALLLAAAWLHAAGSGPVPQIGVATALRDAGHPDLASIVAYSGAAVIECGRRGMPPVADLIGPPVGPAGRIGRLLDIAIVTTGGRGERRAPAARLRELAAERGAGDPSVVATVALLGAMAEDPTARALVESVVPGAVA